MKNGIEEVFKVGQLAVEEVDKSDPKASFALSHFECLKSKSNKMEMANMDR